MPSSITCGVHNFWSTYCCCKPKSSEIDHLTDLENGKNVTIDELARKIKEKKVLNDQIHLLKERVKKIEKPKKKGKLDLNSIEKAIQNELDWLENEHDLLKIRLDKQGELCCKVKRNKKTVRIFVSAVAFTVAINLASDIYDLCTKEQQDTNATLKMVSVTLAGGTLLSGSVITYLWNLWSTSEADDAQLNSDLVESINRIRQFKEFITALKLHQSEGNKSVKKSQWTYERCRVNYKQEFLPPEEFHSLCIQYAHDDLEIKKILKELSKAKKISKDEDSSEITWKGEKGTLDHTKGIKRSRSKNTDETEIWQKIDELTGSKEHLNYLYVDGVKIEREAH